MPSSSPTNSAPTTTIRSGGSDICSRSPSAPAGWWSTPASTPSAGRASRACKFFVDVNGSNPEEVASEVDRYCSWPGQACGYKVGHSEINRQREKAKTALGREVRPEGVQRYRGARRQRAARRARQERRRICQCRIWELTSASSLSVQLPRSATIVLVLASRRVRDGMTHGLTQHHRVLDRDFVEHLVPGPGELLDDPHLVGVEEAAAPQPGLVGEPDGVEDERVAFPAADRVAHVGVLERPPRDRAACRRAGSCGTPRSRRRRRPRPGRSS